MDPVVIISSDKQEDSRYHKPSCKWVDNIKPANRLKVNRSVAKAKGYSACAECKPG